MDKDKNWTERKTDSDPPDSKIWIRRTKFGLYGEMNPRPEIGLKVRKFGFKARTKYGVYKFYVTIKHKIIRLKQKIVQSMVNLTNQRQKQPLARGGR